jgi:hypothetical protein
MQTLERVFTQPKKLELAEERRLQCSCAREIMHCIPQTARPGAVLSITAPAAGRNPTAGRIAPNKKTASGLFLNAGRERGERRLRPRLNPDRLHAV